jgi:predicted nucleotidyltransferase
MAEKPVLEIVREYALLVSSNFRVKTVVLFGSFALGTQRSNSYIDVAVVMKTEPVNIWQVESELFRLARQVDFRIEPILVDDKNDRSGFWEEISKYGKVIYN